MKRDFEMKKKAFFIVFEGLSFGEKIKIADTGFKYTALDEDTLFFLIDINKKIKKTQPLIDT